MNYYYKNKVEKLKSKIQKAYFSRMQKNTNKSFNDFYDRIVKEFQVNKEHKWVRQDLLGSRNKKTVAFSF